METGHALRLHTKCSLVMNWPNGCGGKITGPIANVQLGLNQQFRLSHRSRRWSTPSCMPIFVGPIKIKLSGFLGPADRDI